MPMLNGKTAVVTGANSGMGMATAAALADMELAKHFFAYSEELVDCLFETGEADTEWNC